MKKRPKIKAVIVYQAKSGAIELRGDFARDTIWATQDQIAELFDTTKQNISQHLKAVFKTEELAENSVVKDFFTTASDGKQYKVKFYNLDAIISVGYRVNSKKATVFRKWATKMLRQYITEGYAINRKLIAKNYERFMHAVEDVRALLPTGMQADTGSIVELISAFADTWLSLDAYDKDLLPAKGVTKKSVALTAEHLRNALADFKTSLMAKGKVTDLFAMERQDGLIAGIVGNVMQSFGGTPVYATIEEKAAHLLYFMVKNHPFTDGNKRSGAFAFVWFLPPHAPIEYHAHIARGAHRAYPSCRRKQTCRQGSYDRPGTHDFKKITSPVKRLCP